MYQGHERSGFKLAGALNERFMILVVQGHPFRARMDRHEVAQRIASLIEDIEAPNFKATVKEPGRHAAYMDVWGDAPLSGRAR